MRCAGIARVATERGVSKEGGNVALLTHPLELALIRKFVELPEIIEQTVDTLNPHILAHWAHTELAQVFHRTYEEVRALHRDVPADLARARLKLYAAAQIVIAEALHLMGMNAPDFM